MQAMASVAEIRTHKPHCAFFWGGWAVDDYMDIQTTYRTPSVGKGAKREKKHFDARIEGDSLDPSSFGRISAIE